MTGNVVQSMGPDDHLDRLAEANFIHGAEAPVGDNIVDDGTGEIGDDVVRIMGGGVFVMRPTSDEEILAHMASAGEMVDEVMGFDLAKKGAKVNREDLGNLSKDELLKRIRDKGISSHERRFAQKAYDELTANVIRGNPKPNGGRN